MAVGDVVTRDCEDRDDQVVVFSGVEFQEGVEICIGKETGCIVVIMQHIVTSEAEAASRMQRSTGCRSPSMDYSSL